MRLRAVKEHNGQFARLDCGHVVNIRGRENPIRMRCECCTALETPRTVTWKLGTYESLR